MAEDYISLLKFYQKQVKIEINNDIQIVVSKNVFNQNPVLLGDIINKEEYIYSIEESLKKEALHKAVSYLSMRARSSFEIEEKLREKAYSENVICAAVNRLKKEGLLNDKSFTENWVKYRLSCNVGKFKIVSELLAKGINKSMIDEALESCNYEISAISQAQIFADKYIKRYVKSDPLIAKQKTIQALLRKGFSYDIAKSAVDSID